jgi:hypothetical protein
MKDRDQYVKRMKEQLDAWNADIDRWEAEAREAIGNARERQENARYQMRLLQAAGGEAWKDIAKGADAAVEQMREAVAQARTHFARR